MSTILAFDSENRPSIYEKKAIVNFLFENLEKYGDPKCDIEKAIDYSLKELPDSRGGFVLVTKHDDILTSAVVVNETGMKDYIPENILVYIATHKKYRGQGIGKQLMQKVINKASGGIALHVDPDNPARRLYERLGFESKYVEMRYSRAK